MSQEDESRFIGGLLTTPAPPIPEIGIEDFGNPKMRTAFQAICALRNEGAVPTHVDLAEKLRSLGELDRFGGPLEVARLEGLAANLPYLAGKIKGESLKRKKLSLAVNLTDVLKNGGESGQVDDLLNKIKFFNQEPGPGKKSLSDAVLCFEDFLTFRVEERKKFLPWLFEGSLAMVYGPRGIGKTMFGLGLASALVRGESFLKWPVAEPASILYVDGEMSLSELRERSSSLLTSAPNAKLFFLSSEVVYQKLEKDLKLTSEKNQAEVDRLLKDHPEIRIVILDNISCLFSGLREENKADWEPVNTWLIRLRHRGLSVVLMHHGGKAGDQRGTSGREDALDIVIKLSRPTDYSANEGLHFELYFTKSRSVQGDDVNPLDVRLEEIGGTLIWTFQTIEQSLFQRVKGLIYDGLTSPSDIAEELKISKGYASKLKKKVEKEMKAVS